VLEREFLAGLDQLVAFIYEDPQAALLHRTTYNLFLTVMRRPLLRALYTAGWDMLGKLVKGGGLGGTFKTQMSMASNGYLPLLVEFGLIRPGITTAELVYAYRATIGGFFISDAFLTEQNSIALERRAELLATIAQRAFEIDPPPPPQVIQALAPRLIEVWTKIGDEIRARLHQAYE
jgi:hypothetical protein